MEDLMKQDTSTSIAKINSNTFCINGKDIYRGRCAFVATLISTGVFHDYSFDSTEIDYIEHGKNSTMRSHGAFSEGQILGLLYYMRLEQNDITAIRHKIANEKYLYCLEINGISNKSNDICFVTPEDNGWILENIINDYKNNRIELTHRVYKLPLKDKNINNIVTLVNKNDPVLGVVKVETACGYLTVIESETLSIVVTDKNIIMTELFRGEASSMGIKEICKRLDVRSNEIGRLIMI